MKVMFGDLTRPVCLERMKIGDRVDSSDGLITSMSWRKLECSKSHDRCGGRIVAWPFRLLVSQE
jgi:hypothetical protein